MTTITGTEVQSAHFKVIVMKILFQSEYLIWPQYNSFRWEIQMEGASIMREKIVIILLKKTIYHHKKSTNWEKDK